MIDTCVTRALPSYRQIREFQLRPEEALGLSEGSESSERSAASSHVAIFSVYDKRRGDVQLRTLIQHSWRSDLVSLLGTRFHSRPNESMQFVCLWNDDRHSSHLLRQPTVSVDVHQASNIVCGAHSTYGSLMGRRGRERERGSLL